MKYGKVLSGLQPKRTKGKASKQEMLPSRHAMSTLVGGSPFDRSMGNYAKLTPSGAGAMDSPYSTIQQEGEGGPDVLGG